MIYNALDSLNIKFEPAYKFWQSVTYKSFNEIQQAIITGFTINTLGEFLHYYLQDKSTSIADYWEYTIQVEDGYAWEAREEEIEKATSFKPEDLWILDRMNIEITFALNPDQPQNSVKISKPTTNPVYRIGDLVDEVEWANENPEPDETQYPCLVVTGIEWKSPELALRNPFNPPSGSGDNEPCGWYYLTAFFDIEEFSSPDTLGAFTATELMPFTKMERFSFAIPGVQL